MKRRDKQRKNNKKYPCFPSLPSVTPPHQYKLIKQLLEVRIRHVHRRVSGRTRERHWWQSPRHQVWPAGRCRRLPSSPTRALNTPPRAPPAPAGRCQCLQRGIEQAGLEDAEGGGVTQDDVPVPVCGGCHGDFEDAREPPALQEPRSEGICF